MLYQMKLKAAVLRQWLERSLVVMQEDNNTILPPIGILPDPPIPMVEGDDAWSNQRERRPSDVAETPPEGVSDNNA